MTICKLQVFSCTVILIAAMCLISCNNSKDNEEEPFTEWTGSNTDTYMNQGNTSACWIYAMLTCIEQERWKVGDSIRLSRHYLLARMIEERATKRFVEHRQGGNHSTKLTAEECTTRNVGPEALRLIRLYGLVPIEQEREHITNDKIAMRRALLAASTARNAEDLRERMQRLLPRLALSAPSKRGYAATTFFYYSMRYTPMQFAESVMYNQQWKFYACSEYHTEGEVFPLESPDNPHLHEYTCLSPDSLARLVRQSLMAGHAVYWEYGKRGRESAHAMAITKIKKTKDGREMLICRNSYGRRWGRKGYTAVSWEYFLAHTCNVGVLSEVSPYT